MAMMPTASVSVIVVSHVNTAPYDEYIINIFYRMFKAYTLYMSPFGLVCNSSLEV